MSLRDIENRLQILEDIESIKLLKAKYCRYCDDNLDADGIASLFTEDGTWEGQNVANGKAKPYGKYIGREEIKKFFQKASKEISYKAVHAVITPVIEVKNGKADGTWFLLVWYMLPLSATGKSHRIVWSSARYDEQYVKIKGEWKFKRIKVTVFYSEPYAKYKT